MHTDSEYSLWPFDCLLCWFEHHPCLNPRITWSRWPCRERKWKLGQAKRFGRLCARSNLDLESRAAAKAKQEAAAIRRRAAWIAKEVIRCCSWLQPAMCTGDQP